MQQTQSVNTRTGFFMRSLHGEASEKRGGKALRKLGYVVSHQTGSHIRLTTQQPSEHHITVPDHDPIKVGTLNSILRDVGEHARLDRAALLQMLFG